MDPVGEGGAPCHHVAPGTPGGTGWGLLPCLPGEPCSGRLPGPQGTLPFAFVGASPVALSPVASTTDHLFPPLSPHKRKVGTAQVTAWQLGF